MNANTAPLYRQIIARLANPPKNPKEFPDDWAHALRIAYRMDTPDGTQNAGRAERILHQALEIANILKECGLGEPHNSLTAHAAELISITGQSTPENEVLLHLLGEVEESARVMSNVIMRLMDGKLPDTRLAAAVTIAAMGPLGDAEKEMAQAIASARIASQN
jgi:hypothetical protein